MSRYKRVGSAFFLNTVFFSVLSVALILALTVLPAWAQDKNRDKAEQTDSNADAKVDKKDAIDPSIDPVALWDGRGLVPFHSIDNPKMVTAAQADFLNDDEYVLALTVNGEARAYPTRFVWWHHFVNDRTDKAGPEYPGFLISYCSVCNTGIRYDSRVNGKPILFDFYGLYNGVVIMCDRDTQSVWLQVEGKAVKGPMTGSELKPGALLDTTWGQWKRRHPDTLVMSPDNEYKKFYRDKSYVEPRGYDRFPMPFFERSLTRIDKRLPMFDKVLAVTLPATPVSLDAKPETKSVPAALHRAYPLAALKDAKGVLNDTFGAEPVVVALEPDTQTANAFSRLVEGKTLTFETRESDGKPLLYDKETGTRWNIEGAGEAGPLMGKTLTRLNNHLSQWYGWVAYFPETSIYGRTDPPQPEKPPVPVAPVKPAEK